ISQDHPIALVGATMHPVSGPAIDNGTLVIEGGRITALGPAGTPVPAGAERIELGGRHIYPGFVDAYSTLGLRAREAVRAPNDVVEGGGAARPNARADVAVNPECELIPVARSNGVLVAVVVPQGGGISGTSAAMMMDGWTGTEMTLKAPLAVH